ncbi:ATP-dependent DNA helicase RecG [Candidatus Parcubacteria bacterium]|nr:ATP-dependent DNA helicase RecG [Candidatus Parcubacteria bacterium]
MDLYTQIENLPGIGTVYQRKLKKIGIKTVRDILYHFPHRYENFSNIAPISKIKLQETVCVMGKILEIKNERTWKKRMTLTQAVIQDNTGAIRAVWFRQPYLTRTLKQGDNVCLAGKVSVDNSGAYLSNPAYEKISANLTHTGRIVPVYPETIGLSSRWLRYIIKPLLVNFSAKIPEILPQKIIQDNNLMPIRQAIWQIHFPDSMAMARKSKERFSFEQLFLIEMAVLRARMRLNQETAPAMPMDVNLIKRFVKSLSFKLTDAQRKCTYQVLKDMEKSRPMNRLLEGDVGSGKTMVALIAALQTIKSGNQVAFMAPTEILAKQHFQEVSSRLGDFNINIGLLTGKEDKFISKKLKNETIEISRKKLIEKTQKNDLDILIGTHALIQDKMKFGELGLIILDEQHRFGVAQRAKLTTKSSKQIPHLLSMTATPIPRTLALTIFGDLDLSIIDQLPKGRKKIITKFVAPANRNKSYSFIKQQIKKGRQVFIICPRIESQKDKENIDPTSPWANVKSVEDEYERLSKQIFPDLKLVMLHGKMTPKEKEKIMKDFKNKKFDILVSTSVIEVGIDVPNASVMVIEGADRFGLSQLHQFRGRVGRSKYQSYCLLFTDSPAVKTRQRLKALISSENGFELAEKDLSIRGPGDFSGTRQWGIPDIAMDSLKNIALVEKTRNSVQQILDEDPELKQYPFLLERLEKFQNKIHLE